MRRRGDDEDEVYGDVPRLPERLGHGNVSGGTHSLVMWILGIFGTVMTILMSLVLQALYSLNGDFHELKGEVVALQSQVANLNAGRSGITRGTPD